MKKPSIHLSILAALLAACLTPMAVKAQLNVGPQFVIPVEGFGGHIRWGYGAGFLMEFPIFKQVSIVGHLDYIHWITDKKQVDNLRLNQVGLQAGVRLYSGRKWYVQGWGGGYGKYGIETNSNYSDYGWAIGAGYLPNRRTDVGLRLQSLKTLRLLALRLDHRFGVEKEKKN
ncbi:MAG: hypothetical protein IT262_14215 [Saprospiraceae bacterium]|nr:hypothetical protein [Saprospiraceae bacterium]